jgi:hypothetical protein
LYLRDPAGLLAAWSAKYPGPAEQVPLYFRGDTAAAEQAVSQWCQQHALVYALAGYSAAWRLAPQTRYNVASIYVEDRGFERGLLDTLAELGGKVVDSGANLQLWRPFDQSVFVGSDHSHQGSEPVTSPIQTYLDVRRAAGRGEEAANAVFDKYLRPDMSAAAEQAKELQGAV